jgi:hypothetical protein
MKSRLLVFSAAAVLSAVPAGAQVPNGPPIPPDQILRQQNAPLPSIPAPVQQAPYNASPRPSAPPRPAPPIGASRDRAAACQHQATVDRVPADQRGSFIHNCINN